MNALICPAPGAVFAATALPLPHCQSVCAPLRSSSVTCGTKSCLPRLATTNKKKWQWALNAADLEAQAPTPPLSIDGDDEEEEEEEEEEEGEEEELQDFSLPAPELQMSRRKKLRLILNTPRKQKVVLKFLWLEKSIGIGLDQVSPGYGAVPLSPYFFWPRKDAWEELKSTLESKPWISRKRAIILLNQATDIINLWQQRGADS